MSTIDNLEVKVKAQAQSATSQLDALTSKLEQVSSALSGIDSGGLQSFANGVRALSSAMQSMSSVKTTDFTRLSKNIEKMSNIKTSNLTAVSDNINRFSQSMNSMTGISDNAVKIGEFSKNISKLGNKSVVNAVDNIPKLAKALNELMTTLSKAPSVSNGVTRLVESISKIASAGSKVKSASNGITSSVNKATTATNNYAKANRNAYSSSTSLISKLAKLATSFYLVKRAASLIGSAIKSSMDYTETVNLFQTAFKKIGLEGAAEKGLKTGSEAAENYAIGFIEEAEAFNQKLCDSLYIDPDTTMNYQAMFASITNAMGMTTQTTKNVSEAFTALGNDIASLYNLDTESAMQKLQAGLVGQTKPLRELGIDITQAQLQLTAYNYGIKDNVKDMSQAEKVQLRYLTIMNQAKVAYGDMAKTINSPANQLRILTQQWKSLCRAIGNVFLPLVSAILPYLNALLIKIRQVVQAIASALGYKVPDYKDADVSTNLPPIPSTADVDTDSDDTSTSGKSDKDTSGTDKAADSVKNIGNQADKSKKKVKELKRTLMSFDEMNKLNDINKDDDSEDKTKNSTKNKKKNSGSGAGTSGYAALDKAIQEATDNYFKKFNSELGKTNTKLKDLEKFLGKVKTALGPTTTALKKLWNEGLKKLGNFMWTNLKNFYNQFLKPVGKWILGEKGLPRFLNITNDLLKKVNWQNLLSSLTGFYKELKKFTLFVFTGVLDFYDDFLKPVAVWTLGEGIPSLIKAFTKMVSGIDWTTLNKALSNVWKALSKFAIGIGQGLINFVRGLSDILKPVLATTASALSTALNLLAKAINAIPKDVLNAVGGAIGGLVTAFLGFKAYQSVVTGITKIHGAISVLIGFLSANPGTAIALGISAICGAIVALSKQEPTLSTDVQKMQSSWDALKQSVDDTVKAQKDWITQANGEIKTAGVAESNQMKDLVTQYKNLAGKAKLTKDEKKQLKDVMQKMCELYPSLKQHINDETGKFDLNGKALDQLTTKTKNYYKVKAYESVLTAAYKKQAEAEIKLQEVQDAREKTTTKLEKKKQQLKKTEEQYATAYKKSGGMVTTAMKDMEKKAEQLETDIKALTTQQVEQDKELAKAKTAYNEATEKIKTCNTKISELNKTSKSTDTSHVATEVKSTMDKAEKNAKTGAGNIIKVIKDNVSSDSAKKEVKEKIKSLTDAMGGKFDDEVKGFDKYGTKAAGQVGSGLNNDAKKKEAATNIQKFIKSAKSAAETYLKVKNEKSTLFGVLGKYVVQGFNGGIKDNENSSKNPVISWVTKIVKWFTGKDGVDEHSPSKKTDKYGYYFVRGFNDSILNNMRSSESVIGKWTDKINGSASNISSPNFEPVVSMHYKLNTEGIRGYNELINSQQNVDLSTKSQLTYSNSQLDKMGQYVKDGVIQAMTTMKDYNKPNVTLNLNADARKMFSVIVDENTKAVSRNGVSPFIV